MCKCERFRLMVFCVWEQPSLLSRPRRINSKYIRMNLAVILLIIMQSIVSDEILQANELC
jgi:hypothetical protein